MGIIIYATRHRAVEKRNGQIISQQSHLRRIAHVTRGVLTRCWFSVLWRDLSYISDVVQTNIGRNTGHKLRDLQVGPLRFSFFPTCIYNESQQGALLIKSHHFVTLTQWVTGQSSSALRGSQATVLLCGVIEGLGSRSGRLWGVPARLFYSAGQTMKQRRL